MIRRHLPWTRRRALQVAAVTAATGFGPLQLARGQPDADAALLSAVIAGGHRAAGRQRDNARRPFETLRYFGVASDHTVLELAPGGGWYTDILAPYLRDRGQLLSAHFAADSTVEYERRSRERYDALLAASPSLYDKVRVGTLPGPLGPRSFDGLTAPGSVDRVLTFRNVHNWLKADSLGLLLRASFEVLRPGGVLGVVEHRAVPGTPLAQMIQSGYVTEALVIERARAAGFTEAVRSELNANPRDTRDHPHGVWSLPPSLRGKDVDRDRFLAIGESDRMSLRLVKPAR